MGRCLGDGEENAGRTKRVGEKDLRDGRKSSGVQAYCVCVKGYGQGQREVEAFYRRAG